MNPIQPDTSLERAQKSKRCPQRTRRPQQPTQLVTRHQITTLEEGQTHCAWLSLVGWVLRKEPNHPQSNWSTETAGLVPRKTRVPLTSYPWLLQSGFGDLVASVCYWRTKAEDQSLGCWNEVTTHSSVVGPRLLSTRETGCRRLRRQANPTQKC